MWYPLCPWYMITTMPQLYVLWCLLCVSCSTCDTLHALVIYTTVPTMLQFYCTLYSPYPSYILSCTCHAAVVQFYCMWHSQYPSYMLLWTCHTAVLLYMITITLQLYQPQYPPCYSFMTHDTHNIPDLCTVILCCRTSATVLWQVFMLILSASWMTSWFCTDARYSHIKTSPSTPTDMPLALS